MKTRCVIIAGGDCDSSLLQTVCDTDFVIAADSGLTHCKSNNIVPDLLVGDFDSYSGELPLGVETVMLPTHKDDTDLLFASRCGIERGFTDFVIFGGFGSRPDQSFAMYSTLIWLVNAAENVRASAVCSGFEVFIIKNSSISFTSDNNRYLSVFSVDGDALGVTISGAEYPLSDAKLTERFPIGVSNCPLNDTTVSVKNGTLLIMVVDKNI